MNEGARSSEPRRDLRVFFSGGGGGGGGGSGDRGVSWWWNFESAVFFSKTVGVFLVDLRDVAVVVVLMRTCGSPCELLGRFPEVMIFGGSGSGACSMLVLTRAFRVNLRAAEVTVETLESGISCSTALELGVFGGFLTGVSSMGAGISAGASVSFSSTGADTGLGMMAGADSAPAEARLNSFRPLRIFRTLHVSLGL